ncbi:MAG: TPM domain-containing protein [Cyanobacteria bacterium P01_D01_bin.50]
MQNQFVRRYWAFIFTLSLVFTLLIANLPSYALTVKEVPNPRQEYGGWVTDMVDMLSPQAESQLNQMISQLEKQNGTEIAIVTVPETKPSSTPKEFTTELFNTWGIGKKGKDNGVLFLISKGDRRTEIETGYGIEGILPDAKVGNILRQQVTPQFKKGNFEDGIIAGTKALIKELGGDIQQPPTAIDSGANNSGVKVTPQAKNTNPFIYLLLVLIALPLGQFIVLPLTRFVFKIFAPSSPSVTKPRQYLSPSGITRKSNCHITGEVYCQQCSKQMQLVVATKLESHLSQPQKVAQKLGSARFQGWYCPNCAIEAQLPQIHLLIDQLYYKAFHCPNCEELTVTNQSTEIIKAATQTTPGIRRKRSACQCCNYTTSHDEAIPRLSPPKKSSSSRSSRSYSSSSRNSSSSNSSSSNDYSSDYSSSSSRDYSSSSSSDFGGGDSGGGGGGDDW